MGFGMVDLLVLVAESAWFVRGLMLDPGVLAVLGAEAGLLAVCTFEVTVAGFDWGAATVVLATAAGFAGALR